MLRPRGLFIFAFFLLLKSGFAFALSAPVTGPTFEDVRITFDPKTQLPKIEVAEYYTNSCQELDSLEIRSGNTIQVIPRLNKPSDPECVEESVPFKFQTDAPVPLPNPVRLHLEVAGQTIDRMVFL